MAEAFAVLYWDTSALLSYFFKDHHSISAQQWGETEAVHLLSSLAYTESCAVLARMTREKIIDRNLAKTIHTAIESGPWRPLNGLPERKTISRLSRKWPLRGADLWHLALAVSLQNELPEIRVLTFDKQLLEATIGEGLAARVSSPLKT